jgi:hypothetical protein
MLMEHFLCDDLGGKHNVCRIIFNNYYGKYLVQNLNKIGFI